MLLDRQTTTAKVSCSPRLRAAVPARSKSWCYAETPCSIQSLTHTDIQDCNKVGQDLDKRLEELGGKRIYALGEGDERTGLTEVEPWIAGLWEALASNSA